jgi:hypothetical protein
MVPGILVLHGRNAGRYPLALKLFRDHVRGAAKAESVTLARVGALQIGSRGGGKKRHVRRAWLPVYANMRDPIGHRNRQTGLKPWFVVRKDSVGKDARSDSRLVRPAAESAIFLFDCSL